VTQPETDRPAGQGIVCNNGEGLGGALADLGLGSAKPAPVGEERQQRESWLVQFLVYMLRQGPVAWDAIVETAARQHRRDTKEIRRAGELLRVKVEHKDGREVWSLPEASMGDGLEEHDDNGQPVEAPNDSGLNGDGQHGENVQDGSACWHNRAKKLADWAWDVMVNRTDVHGRYYFDPNDGGKVKVKTDKRSLTKAMLSRHFKATSINDVVGLHTTTHETIPGVVGGVSRSRWGCGDIDNHGPGDAPDCNVRAALAWHGVLISVGFRPLLIDSNGRGGFHLFVVFDEPILTVHVRQLFRWLTRDWREQGLSEPPECFPKQDSIQPLGSDHGAYGNWARLPGRHPKRSHWSRIYVDGEWVEGDGAIDALLDVTGDPAQLIPNEALSFDLQPKTPRAPRSLEELGRAGDLAAGALKFLGPGAKDKHGREFLSDYEAWLLIGFSLRELDDSGLALWDEWSSQDSKYRDGFCAEKWGSISKPGDTGIGLDYLFHYAEMHGWKERPRSASQADVNEGADDPHRLARLHSERHHHRGESTLRFYRGEPLVWTDGAYRPILESELQAGLSGTVKDEFDRINRAAVKLWEDGGARDKNGDPVDKPEVRRVTRPLVGNVSLALQSMTVLPGKIEAPFWIGQQAPFDPAEVMPIRNALVHLPSVVFGDQVDRSKFVVSPTPRFFSTYALDFDFDLDADPPIELIKFLVSIWRNDAESVDALQEWFGYCLTPDTRQQKIGTFIGPKRSGRGTIARLLKALVGPENVAGPRLSALATNFGLEPMIGKPLAIISDARLSGRSDKGAIVESLLTISGEDTITIDRKNKPAWTGKLPTRLMLLSNELPKLPDESGALVSRQLLWRFKESFLGREDLGLDARLAAELPSILNWAIAGWQRLRERGHFLQPKSGQDLLEQMLDISSPVGAFVRERLVTGAGHQIDVADLFAAWCTWCDSKKRQTGDEATFGRNLRAVLAFIETKQRRGDKSKGEKSHIRYFEGVALKNDDDGPEY